MHSTPQLIIYIGLSLWILCQELPKNRNLRKKYRMLANKSTNPHTKETYSNLAKDAEARIKIDKWFFIILTIGSIIITAVL